MGKWENFKMGAKDYLQLKQKARHQGCYATPTDLYICTVCERWLHRQAPTCINQVNRYASSEKLKPLQTPPCAYMLIKEMIT